jgi:hypothetical protein
MRKSTIRTDRPMVIFVWSLCFLALGAMTLAVVVDGVPDGSQLFLVAAPPYALAGAFIATRVPTNRFGWFLYGAAVSWALLAVLWHVDLPEGVGALPFLVLYTSAAFVMLLLPDGSLPSARWRWVAWGLVLTAAAGLLPDESPVLVVVNPIFVMLGITAASAPIFRYRRASGLEKAQLKWPAYVIAVGVGAMVLAIGFNAVWDPLSAALAVVAIAAALVGLPASFAVSITRYRLYEIDRIINRTAVYGLVVALLAGVYGAGVLLVSALLPGSDDSLAVAASTLLVAFLFRPLQSRVQVAVDRRFYRSRYDAREVADSFAGQLREEIDPRLVAERWAAVVNDTMQPKAIGYWIG